MASRRREREDGFEQDNAPAIDWNEPSREQIEKGVRPAYVRVVWYSDPEDTYHLCLNCPNYRNILRRNIRVAIESDIRKINEDRIRNKQLTLCGTCRDGQDRDMCTYVTLNISR